MPEQPVEEQRALHQDTSTTEAHVHTYDGEHITRNDGPPHETADTEL